MIELLVFLLIAAYCRRREIDHWKGQAEYWEKQSNTWQTLAESNRKIAADGCDLIMKMTIQNQTLCKLVGTFQPSKN